jgi:hypothetical protein
VLIFIGFIRTKNQIKIVAISTSAAALGMSQVLETNWNILYSAPGLAPPSSTPKVMEKARSNKDIMNPEEIFSGIDIILIHTKTNQCQCNDCRSRYRNLCERLDPPRKKTLNDGSNGSLFTTLLVNTSLFGRLEYHKRTVRALSVKETEDQFPSSNK